MTGQDVINGALRLVGALASGENPTTQESSDALEVLNNMLDSWNTQRLVIYTISKNLFNFTSGKQSYTLGTGGDFNVARPAKISRVSVLINTNVAQPLEIPISYVTLTQWQTEPVKNVQNTFPLEVWDDSGFPLRTLTYWPVPTQAGNQAVIYAWSPLASFADLTTDYSFPPGYAKAIRFNLAVDLAPEFGVEQVNPLVVKTAQDSLGFIKVLNQKLEPMMCDPALLTSGQGVYNWLTDEMIRNRG